MIGYGEYQTLKVLYIKEMGAFLGEEGQERGILLPAVQAQGLNEGDEVSVFIYKDSEDRVIATTKKPLLSVGGLANLTVKETTPIGAFLDWGMEKDLLLPFKEQKGKPVKGEKVLVTMYVDRSERLCATMNIYRHLKTGSTYEKGDEVKGTVYGINRQVGVFVAVDDKYFGMLPIQKAFRDYRIGDAGTFYVNEVREDGKLNLAEGRNAHIQMMDDSERLLDAIDEFGGVLPFGEKADPAVIARELGMSKAAFKRAVGHLYKQGLVVPGPDEIRGK